MDRNGLFAMIFCAVSSAYASFAGASEKLIADAYDPSQVLISASNNYPKVGETVVFSATPYPQLLYYWWVDGDAVRTLGTPQYARQIQKAGPADVHLLIQDAYGRQYFHGAYRVIGILQPQIYASNLTPKIGEFVTFSAPELPPQGFTYYWGVGGETQWTSGGNQFVRQMMKEGPMIIYLKAIDSRGQEYFNSSAEISVAPSTNIPSPPNVPYGTVPTGNVCYQTNWGLLTMTFSREGFYWVSGSYIQKEGEQVTRIGDIKKAILALNPPMTKTKWEESSGRHGDMEINFGPNFNTFSGKYGFGEGNPPTEDFNGTRVDCPSPRTGSGQG